jgi:hypothetical protein
MTSGDSEVLVLAGEQAIEKCRDIRSTVRARFGDSAVGNCVHTAADEAEASRNVEKLLHFGDAGQRFVRPKVIDDAPGLWGRMGMLPIRQIEDTVRSWWRRKSANGWASVWSQVPGGPYATHLRPGDPYTIDYGVSALFELVASRPIGSHISTYIEAEIRRQAVIATGDEEAMNMLTSEICRIGLRAETRALIPQ